MVLIKHPAFPPNVGLADLSGVSKIFYHLRQRFYPVEFADLCTLIDEIVLREHVVLVGKTETTPKHFVDAIKPLIDAGVFRIHVGQWDADAPCREPKVRTLGG